MIGVSIELEICLISEMIGLANSLHIGVILLFE